MSKPREYLTPEEIKQAIDDMIAQNNKILARESAILYTKMVVGAGLLICSTITVLLMV